MIPDLRVEIAFNSGFLTDPADRVWDDVSAYVDGAEGISLTYGRDDELSTASPNTASLTLDNRDGRFTPGKTDGAYFPNVKLGRPIRVTTVYGVYESVRFTGYINEWPVTWPTGGDEACSVTISATSVRARLGQTAPLTSAIRSAYLATGPIAYWPMNEGEDIYTAGYQQAFTDVTNHDDYLGFARELIASFYKTAALAPVVLDGTPGPADELSLVRFPPFTDQALLDTFPHYVGGGKVVRLDPMQGLTMEAVARIQPTTANLLSLSTILMLQSADVRQVMLFSVLQLQGIGEFPVEMDLRDRDTFAMVSNPGATPENDAVYDGEIHHYAMTLTNGNTGRFYFDGQLAATLTLSTPFTQPFTDLTVGNNTFNATSWIGHLAVHNRPLSASELATHAAAATAASESVEERVPRVLGRTGLPESLVYAEPTVAQSVGPQSEAGRAAIDVVDELAQSTGGVLYDSRDGVVVLQARNHRYNAPVAVTLSVDDDEIEADLSPVMDDRYLANRLEIGRGDSADAVVRTDDDSIADYGVYTRSLNVVSILNTEAEAAALNALRRYAQPVPRVSRVTVDVSDLEDGQRFSVLEAEVGTQIALIGLPGQAQAGGLRLFIEGASESISTGGHTITLNTTSAEGFDGWVLGDPALSVLGQTTQPVY